MKNILVILFLFCLLSEATAQRKWSRKENESIKRVELFHSTHAINFPTATLPNKGEWEFEISHRFYPTINSGAKNLWGFDGSAYIRLALGYAIDSETFITLGRSSYHDNYDLQTRRSILSLNFKSLPIKLSLNAGVAWNTELNDKQTGDKSNFQYFAQLILNGMYKGVIGFGLVPSYLYNSLPGNPNADYSLTLGSYLQIYFWKFWSFLVEWNPTLSGIKDGYTTLSAGIELETGGHFFKIIISNNAFLNASQVIAGADKSIADGDWRFGFNITRLLTF